MVNIVFEGVFALFAAIGAATLVWIIVGIFIRPDDCKGVCTYTVVAGEKENNDLKKVVKSLLWWQDMMPEEREIIICGDFSEEMQEEMNLAVGQRAKLNILTTDELGDYLEKQIAENTARDTNGSGNYKAGGNS